MVLKYFRDDTTKGYCSAHTSFKNVEAIKTSEIELG